MENYQDSIVYILTNKKNTVLYVGRTSDLVGRLYEHRNHIYANSFTARYQVYKLVYFEECDDYDHAIHREQQLKGGSRQRKVNLIQSLNPDWKDLSDQWDIEG